MRWIKELDYRSGTGKRWKHVSESKYHTWEIRRTAAHPALGFAHIGKRIYMQIFKDGKRFGPPQRSIAMAKKFVQDWVDEYEW